VIVRCIDIGGLVDRHCLNFLFIIFYLKKRGIRVRGNQALLLSFVYILNALGDPVPV
jgi:hypothetical protein